MAVIIDALDEKRTALLDLLSRNKSKSQLTQVTEVFCSMPSLWCLVVYVVRMKSYAHIHNACVRVHLICAKYLTQILTTEEMQYLVDVCGRKTYGQDQELQETPEYLNSVAAIVLEVSGI